MTPQQMRLRANGYAAFAATLLAGLLLFAALYPTAVHSGLIDHGVGLPERGVERTTATGTTTTTEIGP